MATLSKHGIELGRIHKLTETLAYFSDGKILRNQGQGWKLYKKCKPDVDPVAHWAEVARRANEFTDARPAYVDFRKQLHDFTCQDRRYLVLEALKMLSNDVDGLWSELNDMAGIGCSVEEVQDLVYAFNAYQSEAKDKAQAQTQPAAA